MTMQTYQFTKGVAEEIVWAEVKHFARNIGLHGYTEEEVQSLTRAIQFRVDKDLNPAEVDNLIQSRLQLDHLIHNDAGVALVERYWADLVYDISITLGAVKSRWEAAA